MDDKNVEDEHRSGRSITSRAGTRLERVRKLLQRGRRLTIRMMSEELNIPRETVRKIVRHDLRKRKLCSRFVPRHLTEEQKQQRMQCCDDFILMVNRRSRCN